MDILGGLLGQSIPMPWVIGEGLGGVADAGVVKNFVRTALARRAAAIVANSEFACRYWKDRIGHPRVALVRNAVPLEEIAAAQKTPRATLGLDDSHKVIVYAGRLAAHKNVVNLTTALCRAAADPSVRVIVCGDGPLKSAVSNMIAASDHPERFLHFDYREDIWPLMKTADIFVSVAHLEGCPNTVLEAMACGAPVVVSDIPQHREILSERTAILVDRHDPEAILAGLRDALRQPAASAGRAEAARASIERLSLPAIARQFEAVYLEMIARRGTLPRPVAEKCS